MFVCQLLVGCYCLSLSFVQKEGGKLFCVSVVGVVFVFVLLCPWWPLMFCPFFFCNIYVHNICLNKCVGKIKIMV